MGRGLTHGVGRYRERSYVVQVLLGVANTNCGRQDGIESPSHRLAHDVRHQCVAAEWKMAALVLN